MSVQSALPLISPSPWPRRAGTNVYADFEFWQDNTTWPNNGRLLELSPTWFEAMYILDAAEKTEMTNEWIKVYNASYGGINYAISTAGEWTGYYVVKDGRYVPGQARLGYTTNTVDFSRKYDAMRGVLWDYWTNSNPSDQHNIQIAERPEVGTVNNGALYFSCDRNNLNEWRIYGVDGDGAAIGPEYLAGGVKVNSDSCGLQWEFVKGSHITLKMYKNVNASLDFSTFTMPTWPIVESGNYAKISLTTGNLAKFVPTSILVSCGSSVDSGVGRHARLSYEYKAIGNSKWVYLK